MKYLEGEFDEEATEETRRTLKAVDQQNNRPNKKLATVFQEGTPEVFLVEKSRGKRKPDAKCNVPVPLCLPSCLLSLSLSLNALLRRTETLHKTLRKTPTTPYRGRAERHVSKQKAY